MAWISCRCTSCLRSFFSPLSLRFSSLRPLFSPHIWSESALLPHVIQEEWTIIATSHEFNRLLVAHCWLKWPLPRFPSHLQQPESHKDVPCWMVSSCLFLLLHSCLAAQSFGGRTNNGSRSKLTSCAAIYQLLTWAKKKKRCHAAISNSVVRTTGREGIRGHFGETVVSTNLSFLGLKTRPRSRHLYHTAKFECFNEQRMHAACFNKWTHSVFRAWNALGLTPSLINVNAKENYHKLCCRTFHYCTENAN